MIISELISSIRGMNKLINSDARITDRFIYNEGISIKNTLIRREAEKGRLYNFNLLFKTLDKVELISVDTIEACGIKSDCKIKRTKDKLPVIIETDNGFIVRNVTSLDGTKRTFFTTDLSFRRKIGANEKHSLKEVLSYMHNGYMYFPNVSWPYAKIEAAFEDPDEIDSLNSCDDDTIVCSPAYERSFPIPNYLEAPLKDLLNQSLSNYYHRLREDNQINKDPNK